MKPELNRVRRTKRTPTIKGASAGEVLDRFLRANLFLFFRARAAGEMLAQSFGQSTGKWSLMRSVREEGPQTVAEIARARPVARQGVQRMADQLAHDGLIEYVDNPAHRRARLVRLTPEGADTLRQLGEAFAPLIAIIANYFSEDELLTANSVVRKLSTILAALQNDTALRKSILEIRALLRLGRPSSVQVAAIAQAIDARIQSLLRMDESPN